MGMFNIARCIISELHSQKGIQICKPQAHSCNSQITRSQDKWVTPLHISANKGNIHCYESCIRVSDLQEFGGANSRNNVSLYNLADLIRRINQWKHSKKEKEREDLSMITLIDLGS